MIGEITRVTAMVEMRDGIRLATDIYLPIERNGFRRLPALLERTPYDKRGTNHGDRTALEPVPCAKPQIAEQFVCAGYAYVLQDCRGRYNSEGEFTKYLNEGEDGYDTIAWIARQPWCNGRIGTLGLSYCAHVQAAASTLDPPGLAAMFLDCGGFSSAYHNGVRQGGAFEMKQCTWAYNQALESARAMGDGAAEAAIAAQDIRQWLHVRPWTHGNSPVSAMPDYEDYIVEQWQREQFSDFWRQRGIYWRGFYAETADVPMVHLSGWYDPYSITAIENFVALSASKTSPMRLVLGPWTHGQRSASHSGNVDFGPAAPLDGNIAEDFTQLRIDWFDRILKDVDAPDHLPSPVRIFVMGGGSGRRTSEGRLDHGGHWRGEAAWPLPSAQATTWHLHGSGRIAPAPPTSAATLTYHSDPSQPVPTIGGAVTSGVPVMNAGAFDQRETPDLYGACDGQMALADRNDVLVFQTDPLDDDVEVTGQVVVRLFVSSSAIDTDFTIKLLDVYPPSEDWPEGFAMNLAHGILRARFRRSFAEPLQLSPGQVEQIEITLFPTSNLFVRGHHLRVDIAGSNFPHFDVNPNSNWRDPAAQPVVAENTVYCSRDKPSCVILPIVSRAER